MAAYLFVHFIGEQKDGEQVYFSVSRDGFFWEDLNNGKLILKSQIGTLGVRDPFLVRHPKTGRFYLIATDLRIEAGLGWGAAQTDGSLNIIIWESDDLVHWSKERAAAIGVSGAGCVWAPEAVYDTEKEAFLVFGASKIRLAGESTDKHRIYAWYTKDFREFSEPFIFMEKEKDVIDSTIVQSHGTYFRFTKDETTSRIILEASPSLTGNYVRIPAPVLEELEGVEGPECYLLPDKETWCLIVDRFKTHQGYLPILTKDPASGEFEIMKDGSYDMGKTIKRHGGVLEITEEEYEALKQAYPTEGTV